jgi:hypothetical protein
MLVFETEKKSESGPKQEGPIEASDWVTAAEQVTALASSKEMKVCFMVWCLNYSWDENH